MQVIQFQLRQLVQRFPDHARRKLNMRILHVVAAHPRESFHITLRNSFPDHLARKQISAFTHGMAYRGSIQKFDRLLCDRVGILEGDQRTSAVVQ